MALRNWIFFPGCFHIRFRGCGGRAQVSSNTVHPHQMQLPPELRHSPGSGLLSIIEPSTAPCFVRETSDDEKVMKKGKYLFLLLLDILTDNTDIGWWMNSLVPISVWNITENSAIHWFHWEVLLCDSVNRHHSMIKCLFECFNVSVVQIRCFFKTQHSVD